MGLLNTIFQAFGVDTTAAMREAAGVTIDADEMLYRRLSDQRRDLPAVTQQRMREMSLYLWRVNGLGNWLVEIQTAYLLAEGVHLCAKDPEAQDWLDAFWTDPINNMELKLPKKVRELSMYGEQCWPVFVNSITGHVRLGYIDPDNIDEVLMDPDNPEQPVGIKTKGIDDVKPHSYRVIVNGPESIFADGTQQLRATFTDGECFYFKVNDLSNTSRGTSDLLPVADWLDAYDSGLWSELSRWEELRAFIWDVTLTGATQEEVDARAAKFTSPAPGSTRIHNEAEIWKAETPDLKAQDGAGFARLFRNHILGARGVPEHWFGGGGDVNRATAGEMGEPAAKLLSMRQKTIGGILRELGTYQVRQRVKAITGGEAKDMDPEGYEVTVVWPEMTSKDTSKYAAALAQVVAAAAMAVERGLVSEQTAVELIAAIAGRLGVDIDAAAELVKAKDEAKKRQVDQQEGDLFGGIDELGGVDPGGGAPGDPAAEDQAPGQPRPEDQAPGGL
ncbi:hypothetical protein [Inquilinus sp. CA228]|uniref:hypothetical protein n=1 Tax=Inquilinus sp. CA228 TaxID=3455609 RepID=UPI003F8D6FAA